MSCVVIKVENVYKEYRLGTISHGTLYKDLQSWWARARGKEDPNSIISMSQPHGVQRSSGADSRNPHILALSDVSFDVQKGEILGIIGRNGAGKSTLLKILSEVTAPTKGSVRIRGRIASLLEVGTGFHPELTGRENIYLNGAILGMSRREIGKKFDEIVDFAEVGKFIDTPVKRYSSGMYVRLAFAVAAHLEQEILVLDEVLAVGDAQFQKKCLGKMGDAARDGRTVLFVSHNMAAVRSLCGKAILLEAGRLKAYDEAGKVVDDYLSRSMSVRRQDWETPEGAPGNSDIRVKRIALVCRNKDGGDDITVQTPLNVEFEFWNLRTDSLLNLSMHVYKAGDELIFAASSPRVKLPSGVSAFVCHIPGDLLNDGLYKIAMMIVEEGRPLYTLHDGLIFEVFDCKREGAWFGKWPGAVRPRLEWDINVR
jgi:lipopolysaccharide transport system ATP-binding protein